jgi:hypothetical protein
MRKWIFCLLVAWTATAHARLGESEEQLFDRYGLPKKDPLTQMLIKTNLLLQSSTQYVFEFQGWRINAALLLATDGKKYVVRQTYQRSDGRSMKDYEIKAILDAESDGKMWKPQRTEVSLNLQKTVASVFENQLFSRFIRTDGAIAEAGTGGVATIVKVELPQARTREEELKKIEERKRQESTPKF